MKRQLKLRVGVVGIVTGLLLLSKLMSGAVATAATASIARSYAAATSIQAGSIVSLTSLASKSVTLANTSNSDKIIGVAVATNDSLLVVDPDSHKVQITTSGIANVLVSDVNGPITVGDKVAVSPFDGVGMKSGSGERIIGLAQTSFNSQAKILSTQQVKDKQGRNKTIHIGEVEINVIIGNDDAGIDTHLSGAQRVVRSLTGHTVSTVRVIISLSIALCALIGLSVLIYSAVFGSIVSIGRNPLAKASIFRALRSVLVLAVAMLFIAFTFIYLLLR